MIWPTLCLQPHPHGSLHTGAVLPQGNASSEKLLSLGSAVTLGLTPATSSLLLHTLPIECQGVQLTGPPSALSS